MGISVSSLRRLDILTIMIIKARASVSIIEFFYVNHYSHSSHAVPPDNASLTVCIFCDINPTASLSEFFAPLSPYSQVAMMSRITLNLKRTARKVLHDGSQHGQSFSRLPPPVIDLGSRNRAFSVAKSKRNSNKLAPLIEVSRSIVTENDPFGRVAVLSPSDDPDSVSDTRHHGSEPYEMRTLPTRSQNKDVEMQRDNRFHPPSSWMWTWLLFFRVQDTVNYIIGRSCTRLLTFERDNHDGSQHNLTSMYFKLLLVVWHGWAM